MGLFDKFKSLLGDGQASEEREARALQLANAALLVEVSYADFEADPRELDAAAARLAHRHRLSEADARTLVDDALAERKDSVSLHDYLSAINDGMDQDQKAGLIEDLWAVAYADDRLDCHEEHRVRKIAELLYVPHVRFIRAKHRAQDNKNNKSGQ